MSITAESMTPADIRACTSNNDGGMWGGDWLAYILLFALIGGGGFGFGGFGGGGILPWLLFGNGGFGGNNCATQADLAAGFNNSAVLSNLNDLALGQAGIQQALCQGFNGVNTTVLQGFNGVDSAICNLGYNVQSGFNGLSRQIADCCCDTRAAIADVKYQSATNACAIQNTIQNTTRDVIENQNANSRAILDALNANYIRTLEQENSSLRLSASQSAQNAVLMAAMDANKAEILRKTGAECPTAAYIVQPPQPVTFPTNCCGQVNYANGGCGSF